MPSPDELRALAERAKGLYETKKRLGDSLAVAEYVPTLADAVLSLLQENERLRSIKNNCEYEYGIRTMEWQTLRNRLNAVEERCNECGCLSCQDILQVIERGSPKDNPGNYAQEPTP